jgi:hypothetical protein
MLVAGQDFVEGGIVCFALRGWEAKDADHEFLGDGIAVDVRADLGTEKCGSKMRREDEIVPRAAEIQADDAFGDLVPERFEEAIGVDDEVRDMADLDNGQMLAPWECCSIRISSTRRSTYDWQPVWQCWHRFGTIL